MKERAKGIGEQIKQTSPFVIGGALVLVIAAFGIGLAAGDSNSSHSDQLSNRGEHHRGGPGGRGPAGPGQGRPFGQLDQQAMDKFRRCLKGEGVEAPTPGNPPSNSDRDKLRSAFQKCNKDLPGLPGQGQGGPPPGGGQGPGPGGPPGGGPGQPPY